MKRILTAAVLSLASAGVSLGAQAGDDGTIVNLERERAALVTLMLDPGLTSGDRSLRMERAVVRLMPMERMAIRDDRLIGSDSRIVRDAFSSYDTTFLVHASAEAQLHVVDHWFEQVGLSTDAVLASRRSFR
jgi:hypothetical protein